tara:strand:- start:4607 stop:6274 length:1668 start_codon:yes stop_codon:yes gene_type:complete
MKDQLIKILKKETRLGESTISSLLEVPPNPLLGDYAFPCFSLAKKKKKNPAEIASSIASKIHSKYFERVESKGPYVNFFLNRNLLAKNTISQILKEKDEYGSQNNGKNKVIAIDMSSPNIAKPFGIGHLRSTIIGNSVAKIAEFQGFKVKKINYLGDWGTPFGKIIAGFNNFGSEKKLKENPVKHLYEIYTKASADKKYEKIGRETFKKLESGDKETVKIWKKFKELSLEDFNKVYDLLGIKFDVHSSESQYNKKMKPSLDLLKKKKLLVKSQGAQIVNLKKYNLGVSLIQKNDGTTLYATRDITAALDRVKKYKADFLFYEVGAEQQLYFKQLFKILELMGYKWAKNCKHISHGFYLDEDGKKFATRKGKSVFMEDILLETKDLASARLAKREKLSKKDLNQRSLIIARAAIIYGDLKNYRAQDMTFNLKKFLEFEGNTGPYLLYTYARSRSILRKSSSKKKKVEVRDLSDNEKSLVLQLANFPAVVESAYNNLAPNHIANYAHSLAQSFNEFYHATKVIGADNEAFLLMLVESFSQTLKNALNLLGISVLERM